MNNDQIIVVSVFGAVAVGFVVSKLFRINRNNEIKKTFNKNLTEETFDLFSKIANLPKTKHTTTKKTSRGGAIRRLKRSKIRR